MWSTDRNKQNRATTIRFSGGAAAVGVMVVSRSRPSTDSGIATEMSHDTWIHRGIRAPIRRLAKTPVTPNQLTTLRLVTGLGAAAAFALGSEPFRHLGAGVFILSVLLDRADGELARLSGKTSRTGHVYDLFADAICNAVIFVGLGVGLRASHLGSWAILMGALAGGAVATILALNVRMERAAGERTAELPSFAGFDVDDAILAVPLAVWLGWEVPLLVAATIAAPAFAIVFAWIFRRKLVDSGGPDTPIARDR